MSQLIDTTEMYLKTIFELNEEDIPALRARIVERLGQSGPTVSETVSRMERSGLVSMGRGREIDFTEEGRHYAIRVMRRHRLVERLLQDVIKLDWPHLHDEACRWEHVVSDDVAERIDALLGHPEADPFGNPIPAAGESAIHNVREAGLKSVMEVEPGGEYVIERLAESVQLDLDILSMFSDEGLVPGVKITVDVIDSDSAIVVQNGDSVRLSANVARGVFVREAK
ncbi:Iron-dependent repressor IdeR [Trueperella bernardiae]|uniref:Iron-dependent repressor IdeR n=1 Tax=Trueperella bernardiae TaxID=59561 RepID=A0A0W1KHV3_9ACTO|nr:metal-dependent transcriptional regulator [Trueperella bernardiae]KTF03478.1 Iron-dependent repressor IdeR [Trueperella bernardiae]